jgi:hypothetical protein
MVQRGALSPASPAATHAAIFDNCIFLLLWLCLRLQVQRWFSAVLCRLRPQPRTAPPHIIRPVQAFISHNQPFLFPLFVPAGAAAVQHVASALAELVVTQAAPPQSVRPAPGVLHAQGLEAPTQTLRHVTTAIMHRRQGRGSAPSALREAKPPMTTKLTASALHKPPDGNVEVCKGRGVSKPQQRMMTACCWCWGGGKRGGGGRRRSGAALMLHTQCAQVQAVS